ncbi:hypothetical protein V8B97DRAFT_2020392 [Scleroderma yunnanense]
MDSAPRTKKPRTKSSSRTTESKKAQTRTDEVLVDDDRVSVTTPQNARYAEPSSLAIHSGVELGHDQATDEALARREVEGTLDTDLAELSLGQRLTAMGGGNAANTDNEEENDSTRKKNQQGPPDVVPAHSLTRTLIQALHSSDSRLLETCLAHSGVSLIRNTVRRLPPQLSVPLLLACLERLGRGARAANMKGGGGGASSQRAMVLITWIKTTLALHSGHLTTMPDLVARLAGLHATLTSRLALQDSLLSLNGKLDMVLFQIEMRSSSAPAPLTVKKDMSRLNNTRQPTRYVEGDSDNEDAEAVNAEPQIESGDEEGSVEDIELGGESDEDEDEEEGAEYSDDDDEDSDNSAQGVNGFIDDEAEEFDDEDEDDDSE